jgi:hypothetical protein
MQELSVLTVALPPNASMCRHKQSLEVLGSYRTFGRVPVLFYNNVYRTEDPDLLRGSNAHR